MQADVKNKIRQKIKDFFTSKENIVFVYLFGSVVNKDSFRDIDIAIFMDTMPDMIQLGKLQAALDDLIGPKVDLILLNALPSKNPAFAYEILSKGELLVNKNTSAHTTYKSKSYQYYFDTAYLREQFEDAFKQRMKSKKFGERDYE